MLIFSIVKIKPDIAISIAVTAGFAKNPSHAHIEAIKTIFYYPKGFMDCGITYKGEGEKLSIEDYSDSDWVGDKKS